MIDWTNFSISNDTLNFDFTRKNKEPQLTGLDAAFYNIDYIVNNYPEPYTLYLSGGIDSQAMLYSWVKSKVPFSTFSGIYNFDSNWYDLYTCNLFAKILDIDITYHDFDLINFLETEHHDYAIKYKTGSPQFTAFIKMAQMTDKGTVIFSGESRPCRTYVCDDPPVAVPDLNSMGLYYYSVIDKRPVVPWFFIETETISYSWEYSPPITHAPVIDSYELRLQNQEKKLGYRRKVEIYHKNRYPVIPQDNKLNGFEKIKEYYDTEYKIKPTLQDKMAKGFYRSTRIFDLLFRNKYEDKISKYKYNIKW